MKSLYYQHPILNYKGNYYSFTNQSASQLVSNPVRQQAIQQPAILPNRHNQQVIVPAS